MRGRPDRMPPQDIRRIIRIDPPEARSVAGAGCDAIRVNSVGGKDFANDLGRFRVYVGQLSSIRTGLGMGSVFAAWYRHAVFCAKARESPRLA